MEQHYQYDDQALENGLKDGSLPPEAFSHEAHLRLAWIQIKKYGIRSGIQRTCEIIRGFAAHHGGLSKYHVTLTTAAVRAVYHFMLKSQKATFIELMEEFPRLKSNFRRLIKTHYSDAVLYSLQAKYVYHEPDLLPFDPIGEDS